MDASRSGFGYSWGMTTQPFTQPHQHYSWDTWSPGFHLCEICHPAPSVPVQPEEPERAHTAIIVTGRSREGTRMAQWEAHKVFTAEFVSGMIRSPHNYYFSFLVTTIGSNRPEVAGGHREKIAAFADWLDQHQDRCELDWVVVPYGPHVASWFDPENLRLDEADELDGIVPV